jgi:protein-arginine kinase activator protein McsA
MEAAVAMENFEEAARLRDELRAMTPAREDEA